MMTRARFRELVLEELGDYRGKLTFSFSMSKEGPWTLWLVHRYTGRDSSAVVSVRDEEKVARAKLRQAIFFVATGGRTA